MPPAEAMTADLAATGRDAHAFQADLTTAAADEALIADARAAMGGIGIAIDAAGMAARTPMVETNETGYDAMFAVSARAADFVTKKAGGQIEDEGKICTLVMSLLGAFTPFNSAYAGAKAPVEHFTRAVAQEFGERGISVTALGPGPTDTPFFYLAAGWEAVAYHKGAAAPSGKSSTG